MRCVVCGKESSKSICASCYVERNEIVWIDDIIELITCPRCGFFKISGRWRDVGYDKALDKAIGSSLRIHPELDVENVELEGKGRKLTIRVSGKLWGESVEQAKTFEVRVLKEVCMRCSREAGGYYESIVQVRADSREIDEDELNTIKEIVMVALEKEKENEKAFISKVVERRGGKEGIDYYIGDRNLGRKISRRIAEQLGGVITESKKISGRKDGRDVYRFTYSVRLPAYRRGDIVEVEGKFAVVTNPRLGKGVLIETGDTVNLKRCRVIAKRKDVATTVVVNADSAVVEVLHPITQEVVTAKSPIAKLKPGDEVYVFEYEESVHVIPAYLLKE